jgi:diadenylate cyclase
MKLLELIKQFATENIIGPIRGMDIVDYADVLLLTVTIFMLILFLKNRRAGKLAIGFFLIIVVFIIVNALQMKAMQYILSSFYQIGFIAVIIIFQDDLRAALEKVGGFSDKITKRITGSNPETTAISEICKAVAEMSSSMTGALIVIEGETKLGNYADTGTLLDANVSSLLLRNIFFNRSPLHDGAIIIKNMRVHAAGCKLPLSQKALDASLGTRHRAALGVSETASDAIVIVVSEETGTVSLCYNGEIKRGFSASKLEDELIRLILPAQKSEDGKITRKKLNPRRSAVSSEAGKRSSGSGEEDGGSDTRAE